MRAPTSFTCLLVQQPRCLNESSTAPNSLILPVRSHPPARLSSCLCNRNPWLDATTPRKIEFPLPDRRQKRLVFQACSAKMNLGDEVDLEDFVSRSEKISGAEIAAICQEAGLQAVRKNR